MTAAVQRYVGKCRQRAARRYTAGELTGLFFAFSVIGWLWEVGLHIALDGELVNRGVMLGPWLPIYGVGGVLALWLLRRTAQNPLHVFALGTLLCTTIEYAAGKCLLAVYGLRWWDYSMYPLNLDGLVSPLTSMLFGLGCCAAVYAAGPVLAAYFARLSQQRMRALGVLLAVLFALDLAWSVIHPNMGVGVTIWPDGLIVIEPDKLSGFVLNLL
nr:putative ABC transporter permease [uncultured Agathobaculum sp.]